LEPLGGARLTAQLDKTRASLPRRAAEDPGAIERRIGRWLGRFHCPEQDPAKLWRWDTQLTQAKDAFRISKSDLRLPPIFH